MTKRQIFNEQVKSYISNLLISSLHLISKSKTGFTILLLLINSSFALLAAQTEKNQDSIPVVDAIDVLKDIFNIKPDTTKAPKPAKTANVALLPSIGYNPSLGFLVGATISIGKQFGNAANTGYSVYQLNAIYTTKNIFTVQARHNIFREENKWNLQGNWQLSLYGLTDYGLGTGQDNYCYCEGESPPSVADSLFPINYNYLRFLEKVYRRVGNHSYIGGGVSLDIFREITDEKLTTELQTPHFRYSIKHGFDWRHYSSNALLIAYQFNTRDHPIRSYKGTYFDVVFRFDQEWMGSWDNAISVQYDIRKYFSLSEENPEHVLAFWHWANYQLSGEIPYLVLPSTASDTYNRSGRAYTIGRFRGPSYGIFEGEYRFPISRNKLFAGVVFGSLQSASDDAGKGVYESWDAGYGAGLRILFQKKNRAALCVDYARGNCGADGLFFGLNEAF